MKDSLGEVWVDESQCKWLGKDEQKVGVTERRGGGSHKRAEAGEAVRAIFRASGGGAVQMQ